MKPLKSCIMGVYEPFYIYTLYNSYLRVSICDAGIIFNTHGGWCSTLIVFAFLSSVGINFDTRDGWMTLLIFAIDL